MKNTRYQVDRMIYNSRYLERSNNMDNMDMDLLWLMVDRSSRGVELLLQLPKRVISPSFSTGLALSSVDSLRRQGTQGRRDAWRRWAGGDAGSPSGASHLTTSTLPVGDVETFNVRRATVTRRRAGRDA